MVRALASPLLGISVSSFLLVVSACSNARDRGSDTAKQWSFAHAMDAPPPQNVSITAVRFGNGERCSVEFGGDQWVSPTSYPATKAGSRGVPPLDSSQTALLRRIVRARASPTLRFSFVAGRFIIYDADHGPCTGAAPGYAILNGDCNEYYMPSSKVSIIAIPGCVEPPRP
jgi:hypothetical protein